ncbi:hypothetical protein [Thermofilum pendens]|nr:hypothetical protein [Thermofilum pendens]
MLVPTLSGLVAVLTSAVLRLAKGKPSSEDEWSAFAAGIVLAFIDGFMIAYLVPFFPYFASKFLFHVYLYTLLASLTAVLYAMYKAVTDLRVYAAASIPWILVILLVAVAKATGSPTIFLV